MTGLTATLAGKCAREGIAVPLTLADIGCSGGIHSRWREWGSLLTGVGVDVLCDEVERLSREEELEFRYVCARIGSDDMPVHAHDEPSDYALHRSQAYATAMLLDGEGRITYGEAVASARGYSPDERPLEANYSNLPNPSDDPFFSYYERRFAGGGTTKKSARTTTLDALVREQQLRRVDVIKIDVDGWELDVLAGSEKTLAAGPLAVEVEVQFTGYRGPKASTFSNIDTLLRRSGLTLVDLQTVRYRRAALPGPFVHDIPAQNATGAVVWGDALYMRDTLAAGPPESPAARLDARKQACIADAYGFHDWAAEVVLACPGLFAPIADESILDYLASASTGHPTSYEALIEEFQEDPLGFGR